MAKLTLAVLLVLGVLASAADAAPPANDNRAAAEEIGGLPATVRGTTVEATSEPSEPLSCVGATGGSVWYVIPAAAARSLVLDLDAAGDLDAVVDVYRRTRSQLTSVGCAQTNQRGRAMFDFDQVRNASYLIRIAPRPNSVADAFTLRVVQPDAPERPPGRLLRGGRASGTVDRIANPDDAYAVRMRAGQSYRVHLLPRGGCVDGALYPPGGGSFSGTTPAREFRCGEYFLFTPRPEQAGRYSLRVLAPRNSRGARPYRVRVGVVGTDDTAPGLELANDVRMRGALQGSGLDVLDLYRFDVPEPSTLDLRLNTDAANPFNLMLLGAGGRRISCACGNEGPQQIALRLEPGRFFAAVRSRRGADGRYVLSRLSRKITRTELLIDGERHATAAPGRTVAISVRVLPDADGPVTLDVERFDPLAGWQFATRFRPRAVNGSAVVAYRPPSEGRWRVRATFDGTRQAAPSGPVEADLLVAAPLQD